MSERKGVDRTVRLNKRQFISHDRAKKLCNFSSWENIGRESSSRGNESREIRRTPLHPSCLFEVRMVNTDSYL